MSDENLQANVVDHREHKFAMVTRSVLENETVLSKPYEKLIYALLCMYAHNKTKSSFPGVKKLAKKAFCSESTARAALRKLREVGLIKVVPRFDPEYGQQSNTYILLDPPVEFTENRGGATSDE